MFDILLIITLLLLASLLVCLLTLRLSINIKHLCLFFSFITDINELIVTLFLLTSLLVSLLTLRLSISIKPLCLFFHSLLILTNIWKYRTPFPRLLNLTKISNPSVYFDSPSLFRT